MTIEDRINKLEYYQRLRQGMTEYNTQDILKLMNDNFKERDEKIKRLEEITEVLKEAYHVQRIELHALLTVIENQLKEEDECKNFLENVKQMIDEFLAN